MQDSYKQDFHTAFRKDIKNLDKPLRKIIFDTLDKIAQNPTLGDSLSGDLMGIYSYHLKYRGIDYRIAYAINDNELLVYFISAGTRENFYKTIKRRLA